MLWPTFALVVVSFAISLLLTRWLTALGLRFGHVDRPAAAEHKREVRAVPVTGGIAIAAAVLVPVMGVLGAAWWLPAAWWPAWMEPVTQHLAGVRAQSGDALGVIGAALVLHVVGLIDDRRGLGPWPKLAAQAAVAIALAALFGVRIFVFLGEQYGPAGVAASVIITALWLVTVTNAMNFLDNMDGLAAGVGAIIAGLYMAATLIGGQWFIAGLCALLLGALGGFLVYNVAPARVYMGDAGSLVLGILLGVVSVRTTYVQMPVGELETAGTTAWHALFMPVVVLAVPLYDLISVTVIRLSHGKSPFVGDRNHFSHRLVRRGMRPAAAVAVVWLCTLATGLGGVMLRALEPWQAVLVAAQTASVLVLLAVLEFTAPRGR